MCKFDQVWIEHTTMKTGLHIIKFENSYCSIGTRPPNTIPYITYVKFPMFKTLNGQFFQEFHIAAIGYGKYLFIFYWKTVRK